MILDKDAAFRRHINDPALLIEKIRKKEEGGTAGQPPSPEEEVREENEEQ